MFDDGGQKIVLPSMEDYVPGVACGFNTTSHEKLKMKLIRKFKSRRCPGPSPTTRLIPLVAAAHLNFVNNAGFYSYKNLMTIL
jgi:hypothetical protein